MAKEWSEEREVRSAELELQSLERGAWSMEPGSEREKT